MADIDIVPKHSSRAWVWVILAIAVVVLAIWFMNRQPTRSTSADRVGPAHAMNHAVPMMLRPQPAALAG